jgi:MYXO-CTERM domain-containing protein
MRQGTRTVLSMQNNYQGPPENFAMVVPVPVVLQQDNVKTLPLEIFDKVDTLDSPRLVEYWEQDPCALEEPREPLRSMDRPKSRSMGSGAGHANGDLGVTVEAEFTVGEYQIVILSAVDSSGLDKWLQQGGYKIPAGAEPYLRPYVAAGSKFFVAKVDITKVKMVNGMAKLSPLRFHYDTDEFSLPVRLGLMNSRGKQDLIVHILARGTRYDIANYPKVTIPTNLDVRNPAKERFGEFYAALFDRTVEKNPGAVVTEYAWDAGSCDPCPGPTLDGSDLMTLGMDVLDQPAPPPPPPSAGAPAVPPAGKPAAMRPPVPPPMPMRPPPPRYSGGFVLTRLHARYSRDLKDDLVFAVAPPITGGREVPGPSGKLEETSKEAPINNFQGRYAIRHPWTGAIACANPVRGRWGGPPGSEGGGMGGGGPPPAPMAAKDTAFAPRGQLRLAAVVAQDVPEISVIAAPVGAPAGGGKPDQPPPRPSYRDEKPIKKGCDCRMSDGHDLGVLALLGAMLLVVRRRRGAA